MIFVSGRGWDFYRRETETRRATHRAQHVHERVSSLSVCSGRKLTRSPVEGLAAVVALRSLIGARPCKALHFVNCKQQRWEGFFANVTGYN